MITMSNVTDKCMCGLKGTTGDGCKYCNRELYIKCLEDELAELKEQLSQEPVGYVNFLDSDCITWHGEMPPDYTDLYIAPPLRRLSAKKCRELVTPIINEYQMSATPFMSLIKKVENAMLDNEDEGLASIDMNKEGKPC